MNFARAARENSDLHTALQKVVLFSADVHEDAGEKLADRYDAHHIPHFILMDPDGKPLDRWRGYSRAGDWLLQYESALEDPTPIEAKRERFENTPTEALASALGRIASAQSNRKEAVRYYRAAQSLATEPTSWYASQVVVNTASGIDDADFTIDDVKTAADALFAVTPPDDARRAAAARTLSELAWKRKDPSILAPYLDAALESAERSAEPEARAAATDLRIARALLIERRPDEALSLKKTSMPAGWEDDPEQLNDVAWWCFENEVSLGEAEELARRGIALEKDGAKKAEILDTAAEICDKRGKRREALTLASEAAKLDPENEHYRKQIERWSDGAAKKQTI